MKKNAEKFAYIKKKQYLCTLFQKERENFEEIIEVFSENREVAQLVAHYVRDVGVACSSHVFSTRDDLDEKSKSFFVCSRSQLSAILRISENTLFTSGVR